jgi:hypothetical protein
MADDPNRKTPRTFQCRDYLWESFESLSGELECSIDYLINEAMRHYLRAQGRTGASRTTGNGGDTRTSALSSEGPRSATPMMQRAQQPPVSIGSRTSAPTGTNTTAYASGLPSIPGPGRVPAPLPSIGQQSRTSPPVQGRVNPPPPMVQSRSGSHRVLYAVYDGQEVAVTKEEFVIGRTQRMCDLVIRDTNISRQHARVVLHNGAWWIIDNQSTNGVEFHGAKIQQKRVDDGDVFTICGHDVQFVYR